MALIIDAYPIPQKRGRFDLKIERSIDLQVTADEAKKQCDRWLFDEVGYMLMAQEPNFLVREDRAVWHVPIVLTATHVGIVGEVGHVDIDVVTAEMHIPDGMVESMFEIGDELHEKLPPYKRQTVVPDRMPPPHLKAPRSQVIAE